MIDVCPECGGWDPARTVVDGDSRFEAVAICDACSARIPFQRRPLFLVTGASGAGKTTVCRELMRRDTGFLTLESDILWGAIDASDEAGLDHYWNTWLRLAQNIHQDGRSLILCGTVVPDRLEPLPQRRYLGKIHVLSLVTEPEEHARRLRARPAWRESGSPEFVERHIAFNKWLIDHADTDGGGWALLDTTAQSVAESADAVIAWARGCDAEPLA